jgi:hypothetical protein
MTRLGATATVVAPESDRGSSLWPDDGVRPLGAEICWVPARSLAELHWGAHEIASHRGASKRESGPAGLVIARVPPTWLPEASAGGGLLAWTLLLTSSEPSDLLESYGLARLVRRVAPHARIGVTVHGSRRCGEALEAFSKLSEVASRRLGLSLASYGLLVGDLQVYRAIVAQRPIGLVQPQSPAARSLQDVARLLLADARIPTDA